MHIHILHALDMVIKSITQPTTENMEDNNHRASSCTSLTQAMALAQAKGVFRSSYRLSLRWDYNKRALQVLRVLAWARLVRPVKF